MEQLGSFPKEGGIKLSYRELGVRQGWGIGRKLCTEPVRRGTKN